MAVFPPFESYTIHLAEERALFIFITDRTTLALHISDIERHFARTAALAQETFYNFENFKLRKTLPQSI